MVGTIARVCRQRTWTGGQVYRGTRVSDLIGWYIFGDFFSGKLFAVPESSAPGVGTIHKIENAP